jgi:hypothetical protein
MPPALVKAHNELDKVVDVAYSKQAFTSEAKNAWSFCLNCMKIYR